MKDIQGKTGHKLDLMVAKWLTHLRLRFQRRILLRKTKPAMPSSGSSSIQLITEISIYFIQLFMTSCLVNL